MEMYGFLCKLTFLNAEQITIAMHHTDTTPIWINNYPTNYTCELYAVISETTVYYIVSTVILENAHLSRMHVFYT